MPDPILLYRKGHPEIITSSIIKPASSQGLRSHGAAKQLPAGPAPCRNTAKRPPGHAPVARPLPPREVHATRTASPGLPRPAGDHLAGRQGGGCPAGSAGEEEEGGQGGGSAQPCRCCRGGFTGLKYSVATSRASPTHLRDRTAVAQPKAKQLYLQFVLTGTECGFSVCNIHQKPKALQICLAGRVPFSRR